MKFNEQNTQPYDWENEGVYVIEPTDPVEGGEEGVSNRQAKELTRRTRNLHTRMTTAESEIDTLQEQTPIQLEAALRTSKEYTDTKESAVRRDMAAADTSTLNTAKSYANQVVATLVDNSPEALNTLQELAKALGNDPNFATTVMQAIGERMKTTDVNAALVGKFDKTGGEIDGSISMQYPDSLGGRWIKQVIAGTDNVGLHMNRAVAAGRVSQLDVYTCGDDGFAKRMEIGRGILRFQGQDVYHSGNLGTATTAANGLMSKEDKAKLDDMSVGVLAVGRVKKDNGSIDSNDQWGCKACQGTKYNNQQGKYKITHNIGHTKYSISITPVNQGWAKINGHILEKTGTYIVVGMFDTSNDNSAVDFEFEFMLCGVI